MSPRLKKILIRGSAVVLGLILLLVAGVWFLLGTQAGARWLFTRLGALVPGSLEVAGMTGPIGGPLDLRGVTYETDSLEVHIDHVQLDWRLRELLSRRLDVHRLYADGVRIFTKPTEEKEKSPLPDINLRFNVIVRDARVTDLRLGAKNAPQGEKPFVIDRISLATTAKGGDVRVDSLTVRSPTFDADVSGTVRPQGDYPVDLGLRWAYRAPDLAPFSGRGRLSGSLEDLKVVQSLGEPFPAEVNALLHEPLYKLAFDGRLRFSNLNPARIRADLPDLPASGQIALKGTLEDLTSQGLIEATVEPAGRLQADYHLRKQGDAWTIESADILLPGTPTHLVAKGTATLRGENVDLQGQASWENLSWPLRGAKEDRIASSPKGTATISGNLEAYRAEVRADLSAGPVPPGVWHFAGTGDRGSFSFEELNGTILRGRIEGRGKVAWDPEVRWNAVLRGQGIDPAQLSPDFPGKLSFTAATRGRLVDAGPEGTVELSQLDGTLRGQPVAGSAAIQLAGARQKIDRLDVTWSDARLAASGWLGDAMDLSFNLSAPNLGVAVPQGGGSVVAQGRVTGSMDAPHIQATGQGEGLRFGTTAISKADVTADVGFAADGPVDVDLHATGIQSGDRRIEELTLQARGTRASHQITASAHNDDGSLDLALAGGLVTETSWAGQIRRLDLRSKPAGDWSLARPAALEASADAVALHDFCWMSGDTSLCADGGWSSAGPWNVDATVARLPLRRFKPFLPPDLEITGDLDGKIHARGTGATLASADVDLQPGPGELRFPGKEGKTLTFPFEQGSITAKAGAGGEGIARAHIQLTGVGMLSARLDVPRLNGNTPFPEQRLSGRIDVDLNNLAFLEGFVPDVHDPSGSLTGGYDLSGTFGSPRFVGQASLAHGKADIPRLGIELRDMQLSATGDGSGALDIDGSVRSGKGTLRIQGKAGVPGAGTPVQLAITGQRFLAMDTEEISLLVSPDLKVVYEDNLIKVTGDVAVPTAKIEIDKTKKGAVGVSDDVVFINEGEATEPQASPLAIAARVRILLGKDVSINALGLKARPTGSLLAIDEPGKPTRGVGELELNGGTFKAYGQDLTIERGRVIFAGGPIDNPGLDVRAYRLADDGTKAGIDAKGTLASPEVTLWSDPAMAQADALSYLLLGHPLNQATPQEGDQLANAANALGLKGGNLLAKKLAARYGLEEARIESKGSLEQASLVVGKYLSPRLYVTYGVGLFEPVNTFRVRYLLNDKFTLQAESGAATGADILYTVERGGKKKNKKPSPP